LGNKKEKIQDEEMVAKETVPNLGGFGLSIEPASKLRKVLEQLHIYLPYFHGAKPKFKLVLTRQSESQQIHTLYWFIRFSRDQVMEELKIPELTTRQKIELEIGNKLLGYTGDTNVNIALSPNKEAPYYTLYSFRTIAQEELTMTALIAFSACFLATVIALRIV
jgi:hypothetical protein